VEDSADDASIVSVVNELLMRAQHEGATDIHLEPLEHRVRVRFRIDGMLLEIAVPEGMVRYHAVVVSRIKVMANLDIAERRLPQDGRIKATVGGVQNEYRVSILPTQFGETIDIRVLTNSSILTGLSGLGMWEQEQTFIRQTLASPYGVMLVTGPTGSGKTTSLYSFLNIMNETSRKIITIEDPIEYHLDGVTQIQVHPRIGLTFARGLRSMLRHDPDVMMVGEIRDQETAETVIRVALTGHLVFSTVHTNDAPSTPARLLNMGIEPYLLASSVRCILAQRLVRKICPACMEIDTKEYAKELADELGSGDKTGRFGKEIVFKTGAGCEKCHQTGYAGRTAIFEILPVTAKVQELILSRAPASLLRKELTDVGTGTLRDRGLALAALGETSVSEVLRVTAGQDGI
jgi:type II secretory ATPase GspE/PulE/Tfp pilus assembly ATPase PilB-like protein